MAGPIDRQQDFNTSDTVTSTKLNNIIDNALFKGNNGNGVTFSVGGTGSDDGTCVSAGGLEVNGSTGQLQIKDSGVATAKIADSAVTTAKLSLTDGATISKSGASEVIASFTTTQDGSNRGLFIQTPDSATDLDSPFILNTGNSISFEVDNNEAMRIHPQRQITIGTTTIDGQGGASFRPNFDDGAARLTFNRSNSTNNSVVLEFQNNDTTVGQIFHNNSSTTFSTSSDYRLKEDIVEMKDSISRVQALKPVNFAWKVDGTRVDGFLAHEAQEIVPEAVTGTKDAVDENGQPEYQGIDQSKLVPLLTKALQESLTEIEKLKARVSALES